jgi:sulfide:quinone oxidoreductase
MKTHYQILIIGGGTAGIMTAAQLQKEQKSLDIAIIEPSESHYYQPAWTLVGAGTYDYDKTRRDTRDFIPNGVEWIKDKATALLPDENLVKTTTTDFTYDYLIVATGLVYDFSLIEGLTESIDKGIVCSNYTDSKHTWEVIKNFKGGNAIFTLPTTPIKCGGAPQKIAYLAADHFRKVGIDKQTNVVFASPGSVIFGVKPIAETLMKVIERYDIHFKPFYAPVKIDAQNQIVTFQYRAPDRTAYQIDDKIKEEQFIEEENMYIKMPFDMLHLAPPQRAPEFVRESALANPDGWLDVDIHTLQHKKFANVFGLGDVAALPTAKTGAAIRKQVPIMSEHLLSLINNTPKSTASYNGYSSCPLVTGYGKMALAEFDYDNNFTPDPKLKQMLVFDSEKEHWRLWMFKKYLLPYLYWNRMLKGKKV